MDGSPLNRYKAPISVRLVYLVLVCLALAIALELLRHNLQFYFPKDWANAHELDGLTDWKAARLSLLGVSPYEADGLRMLGQNQVGWPPTTAFWYLPMVDFSKALVAEVSGLSLLILLVPHYYLCAKALNWPAAFVVAVLAAALVLSTEWMVYHYEMTQCSEHIAFLYVLTWLFLRKGRDTAAGLCIGVAMTFKLFPGLMVIMMLFGRRWRGVIAAAVTYAIVAVTMTIKFGFNSWLLFLEQEKPITEGWLGVLQNSSLSGLVTQSLFPFCVANGHPTKTGSAIITITSILLITAAVWVSRSILQTRARGGRSCHRSTRRTLCPAVRVSQPLRVGALLRTPYRPIIHRNDALLAGHQNDGSQVGRPYLLDRKHGSYSVPRVDLRRRICIRV